MSALRIDVWSDLACPWCYIGKRRLEAALAQAPQEVELVWRSFELDPSAPAIRDDSQSYVERLAAKYRRSTAEAEAMIANITAVAAADGLDFRIDRVRGGNTFDAHRVLHLAAAHGHQGALKERLLRAYFTEGRALGDHATLVELAAEVGLDAEEVRAALAGDAHAAEVRADEGLARELGISGVPFFVMAGRLGVSGAQPAETLVHALAQARQLAADGFDAGEADPADDAAPACGPDGCA
ncbi:MAG: DsbA family oxidoreductase [Myxococcales bacterium]|nr:DsbA family oxidoreductase [Myxococcales bacterium]